MGPTLPRVFRWILLLAACHHADPPVAPGPLVPAEPDIVVDTMDKECAGLVAALETYQKCPNADDDDRAWARAWMEAARESFAAGAKADADTQAQRTMAINCKRAATSVGFATQRCHAGRKPRVD